MLRALAALVNERWTGPGRPPNDVRFLGVGGSPEGGSTTFLAFPPGRDRPAFVVKVFREQGSSERAERERSILARLATLPSVPHVVFAECIDGAWAIVETVLAGSPMIAHLGADGAPALDEARLNFGFVSRWLEDLWKTSHAPDAAVTLERRARAHLDEFLASFQLDGVARRGAELLRERLPRLAGLGGPIQHGDLTAHNVLIAKAGAGRGALVVDWSDACAQGMPLHDLFNFLTTYLPQLHRGPGLAGFRDSFARSFLDQDGFASVVHRSVEQHAAAIGVDAELAPDLHALYLMERAVVERRRLRFEFTKGHLPRWAVEVADELSISVVDAGGVMWADLFRTLVAGGNVR